MFSLSFSFYSLNGYEPFALVQNVTIIYTFNMDKQNHVLTMINSNQIPNVCLIRLNRIHLVSPEFNFRKHIKCRSYYYRLAVVKPEIATQASFQPESYLPINELNRCSLIRYVHVSNFHSNDQFLKRLKRNMRIKFHTIIMFVNKMKKWN